MSLQVSMFMASSLDGYIARDNGSLDWLDAANDRVTPGEDCGYSKFMKTVDVLVMGRHTFETVLGFGGKWPYGDKKLIILSSKDLEIPKALLSTVSHSSESPMELYSRLQAEGIERIYIDGGVTVERFLKQKLVNDITLTIIPILLGSGRKYFSDEQTDVNLELVSSHAYEFGFVQLRYKCI